MPNPFPGMNPYLEHPDFWADFHNQMIASLARSLVPQLLPKYRVVTDQWIYKIADATAIAVGRPDVAIQQSRTVSTPTPVSTSATIQPIKVTVPLLEEVRQAYLEVRDAATQEVVTTVELLSPGNKRDEGRQKYEAKRQQILASLTNLVEIDLLRGGSPLPTENHEIQSNYRILVSRALTRPVADLYLFNLSDRIPAFPLPLRVDDREPLVDLQPLVNDLHDQLAYDTFVNYRTQPPAPWNDAEVADFLQAYRL